jgi:hypothetical protein
MHAQTNLSAQIIKLVKHKGQNSMLHAHSNKEEKEEELHKFDCETKTYVERKK